MKMHQTTIDKLVKIFENYGGHREQSIHTKFWKRSSSFNRRHGQESCRN